MISPIILSIKIAIIATTITFVLGVFLAYIATKKEFRGKNMFETIIILPMVLPPSVMGYILLVVLGKRGFIGSFLLDNLGVQLVFTWMGAAIAACIVSLPLMYQNAKAAFLTVDPVYEKAARTLGSSNLKVFMTVTFPLAWPGIISGIILAFARALGEFGATLMIAGNIPGKTQTIPTAIYFAVESGDSYIANSLVVFMTVFSFVIIFALNCWLKKKKYGDNYE